ncbi:MAG: SprB repeat-containing protein [Cyclobacteriaceae bacterium]|nr:SprB repeat-containing protein [Cyclobacteriaceae bacterium]
MRLTFRLLSVVATISLTLYMSCSSSDEPEPFDCGTSDLAIQLVADNDPTGCGSDDGSIQVSATGGQGPYQFKIGTGAYGSTATFTNLGGGSFNISVKDNRGCEKQLAAVVLTAPSGPVAGTPAIDAQTNCLSPNGSVTANVTGGTPPYQYKLGSGALGSVATFNGLSAGNYVITVEDDAGCSININATVASNTGITYTGEILAIFQAKCQFSGCHPDNGNWFDYNTAKGSAAAIKAHTANGTMPKGGEAAPGGALSADQIMLIACWVDSGAN